MSIVIVEKNQNSAPNDIQLRGAIEAGGGVLVSVEGDNASRTVTFTGEINHTDFENNLINTVHGARRTSWNFVWGDAG
jgi:hypothetical protein